MSGGASVAAPSGKRRRTAHPWMLPAMFILLMAAAAISASVGASNMSLQRLMAVLDFAEADPQFVARDTLVFWSVRLPRIVLVAMVGALLATAGAIMQGMFRNPLADPALVGISSGGALAACATIMFSERAVNWFGFRIPIEALPLAAFIGALTSTLLLYRIATRAGRTSMALFLLGGLAIAALANSGTGLLVYLADDRQLRDITFWMLGSFAGATWSKVVIIAPLMVVTAIVMTYVARALDLLALGEADAFHTGIAVERLKRICILTTAAAVGGAVAFAGVIGFVGVAVPHLVRLMVGPGHRLLMPSAFLLGAALLLAADTVARIIAAPAEIPIGVITALIGAPFFLYLLLRQRWVGMA